MIFDVESVTNLGNESLQNTMCNISFVILGFTIYFIYKTFLTILENICKCPSVFLNMLSQYNLISWSQCLRNYLMETVCKLNS